MDVLLAPGTVLMNKLRYPVKFGLIFAMILVPLVILSAQLVGSLNEQVDFLENQRRGLAYIQIARLPLEQLQQHRGMTAAYLNGAQEFESRIMSKRRDVDSAMAALADIDAELGETLQTSGMISLLQQQWREI